jgi:hypothetical protein
MVHATGVTMLLSVLFGLQTVQSTVVFGWREPLILAILIAGAIAYGKWRKRPASPIVMILISAVCGVLLF